MVNHWDKATRGMQQNLHHLGFLTAKLLNESARGHGA